MSSIERALYSVAIVAAKWLEFYYNVEIKNVWHRRKILMMELTGTYNRNRKAKNANTITARRN